MAQVGNGEVGIRLSGSGGQGMILAGIILAEAAIVFDAKNAVQTQSYGPEARGGATKAEVIIAEGEIDYPKVEEPHIVLAMNQESADKFAGDLQKGGVLVVDGTYVKNIPEGPWRVYNIPLTKIAREELGRVVVANMIALGALCGLTEVVSRSALEQAVLRHVPAATKELNRRAIAVGYREATAAMVDKPML